MGARQAVLLTPPKPPYPRPLPFRQHPASLTPLNATLTESPLTAANKRLTPKLTRLDATLTKNTGVGATPSADLTSTVHCQPSLPPYFVTSLPRPPLPAKLEPSHHPGATHV